MKNTVFKKIILSVIVVAVILVVMFVSREIAVEFFGYNPPALSETSQKKSRQIEVTLDNESKYGHIVTDKYIYFVGTDKVIVADSKGSKKAELPISTANSVSKSQGKFVIVGDVDGNNIYIIKDAEIQQTITTKGKIKNFSVNSSGFCVAVTEGDMGKRNVTAYNTKGEEVFVWDSGNMLVLNAVIAENNKNIIVSAVDTKDGKMKTVLNFYNVSKSEAVASESYDGELISALTVNGNYVYCVGDTKTLIYKVSGGKKSEISYSGKSVITYEVNNSGIVMAFLESTLTGKRYNIESYTEAGKRRGTFEYDYDINYLDIADDVIAIDRGGLIGVINYKGREKALIDPGVDVDDLCFMGSSSKAVGFTAHGAYVFDIN